MLFKLLCYLLFACYLTNALAGCGISASVARALMPKEPLYVLAGGNFHHDNLDNALYIVDPTVWRIVRRIGLPPGAYEPTLARDPSGRIWIGLGPCEQLLIFSPEG